MRPNSDLTIDVYAAPVRLLLVFTWLLSDSLVEGLHYIFPNAVTLLVRLIFLSFVCPNVQARNLLV